MSIQYAPGEVVLAALVFSDQAGTKRRPVLIVHDDGDDDLLVAPITSQAGRSTHDVFLNDWRHSGLRLASIVRLEKLATISKGTVVHRLGTISPSDRAGVRSTLQTLFGAIVALW